VRLFRTYDPETDADEVPDPWGGPVAGYEETIRIVTAAADGLVATLTTHEHLLSP
jgi:protein-tyrosine-phosphatase